MLEPGRKKGIGLKQGSKKFMKQSNLINIITGQKKPDINVHILYGSPLYMFTKK